MFTFYPFLIIDAVGEDVRRGQEASVPSGRPNVLLILTDDQGWDDFGCSGNEYLKTPRLDRLAEESVTFSNYYVTPVCAPTRAALLTGRHYLRTGVSHVHGGKDFIHPDEVLLPEMFQKAGYVTGMWGKWHSGKTSGYFPWERGFDEAYMATLYIHKDNPGLFNGVPRKHEGWTVETLTDYAIDFIKRNKDKHWFAYVPYLTVHSPLDAPEELIDKYRQQGLGLDLSKVYAMLEQLDGNIARLLDCIDNLDSDHETLILFFCDNGPWYLRQASPRDLEIRYPSQF
jgi:arylsulfatase A-like enzyme